MPKYDNQNIFAKILRKDIRCEKIDSDNHNFSFDDIDKQAPVHSLTIPKNEYKNLTEFAKKATNEEIATFIKSIVRVAEKKEISKTGYRVIINCGPNSHQEVAHLHAHILGGKPLGPIIK